MFFVSRKIVYPFFLVIVSLVVFAIVYVAFLSNSIFVNDPLVSVSGDKVVLKMQIENRSNHEITGVNIFVKNGVLDRGFFLKGSLQNSVLAPHEKYDFVAAFPLDEALKYSVEIKSIFNKPVLLNFELDQTTINPIVAQVFLPSKLVFAQEYTYPVKLCNQSNNDLTDIYWIPNAQIGDFKETFYEQTISIKKSSCETLYSTLTPNKLGKVGLSFLLKIGSIEKRSAVQIDIVDVNK
jgi:hypothetical protein